MFQEAADLQSLRKSGTVLQGSLTNLYVPSVGGASGLVASQVPLAGGVTTSLSYVPTVGDTIYVYDPTTLGYDTYSYKNFFIAFGPVGYRNPLATYNHIVVDPQINVAQGFWLTPKNSGEVWTNNFTVH